MGGIKLGGIDHVMAVAVCHSVFYQLAWLSIVLEPSCKEHFWLF
jgi:hypothetical protein